MSDTPGSSAQAPGASAAGVADAVASRASPGGGSDDRLPASSSGLPPLAPLRTTLRRGDALFCFNPVFRLGARSQRSLSDSPQARINIVRPSSATELTALPLEPPSVAEAEALVPQSWRDRCQSAPVIDDGLSAADSALQALPLRPLDGAAVAPQLGTRTDATADGEPGPSVASASAVDALSDSSAGSGASSPLVAAAAGTSVASTSARKVAFPALESPETPSVAAPLSPDSIEADAMADGSLSGARAPAATRTADIAPTGVAPVAPPTPTPAAAAAAAAALAATDALPLPWQIQAAAAAAAASASALHPEALGELLGGRDAFSRRTLELYMQRFGFAGMEVDVALRALLRTFRLPGEAQQIDRIMQAFARRYNQCNPNTFRDADTAYLLAFSIVMLATDAHSPNVRHKMTLQQFCHNLRGLDGGHDLDPALLQGLYARITSQRFEEPSVPGTGPSAASASPPPDRRNTM